MLCKAQPQPGTVFRLPLAQLFQGRSGRWQRVHRRASCLLTGHVNASLTGPEDWSLQQSGTRRQHRTDLNIVLVHPEIPQNAGNIARTCAATAVGLHLVRPLGFEVDSRRLKRAGLDYWPYVVVRIHDSWQAFAEHFRKEASSPKRLVGFSKRATAHYASPGLYRPGDWLVFGAETSGLPEEIPLIETHVRSLNLSVAAGVGLYEAIRQIDQPATAS